MRNMKFERIALYFAIGLLFLISIFSFNFSRKIKIKDERINTFSDSISYLNGEKSYYADLLKFKMISSNSSLNDDSTEIYNITADTSKSTPIKLKSILGESKHSLILRYTEIGCDECSSLTLKKLKELKDLHPDLPIYAFVDFTNYDSYLQWRKVGEVDFPIFYIKKQGLTFDKYCSEYSYVFLLNKDGVASDFFVPNSGHPDMMDLFFDNLYKRGL